MLIQRRNSVVYPVGILEPPSYVIVIFTYVLSQVEINCL